MADVAVANANAAVSELRRLFLVEDLVDTLKFGGVLWCLTYLGSWFNGMTLVIIGTLDNKSNIYIRKSTANFAFVFGNCFYFFVIISRTLCF